MFLRQLLIALGRRSQTPSAQSAPVPSGYAGPIAPVVGLPKDRVLSRIEGGDDEAALDAFLALPLAEQHTIIEREIGLLSTSEQQQITELLRPRLKRPWIAYPGPQTAAYLSLADILFYGGGAGSGKTALLCGTALCDHRRIRLFRRESVQTRGLVDEVMKWRKGRDGYNGQDHLWRLPDDRVIEFAHCQHEDDKNSYQGRQADLVGFDEITHFSETQFRYLINWNRPDRKGQRCRVICTGNPPETAEGRWVIAYWAPWLDSSHPNPAKEGELRWFTTIDGQDVEVDGPGPHGTDALGLPIIARSRTFIRGLLRDNPALINTGYAAQLQSNPEPLRSMLLEGRFDIAVEDDAWQVIPSEWIRLAQERWTESRPGRPMTCIGVDIAYGGSDETVLAPRYGTWFAPMRAIKGVDTKDTAGVAGLVFATMRDGCEVAVDVGGGWGADAHGHLKAQGIRSTPVNWVLPSTAHTRAGNMPFLNQRAEAWWKLREALDPTNGEGIALPPDKTLAIDLATPRWTRTPAGAIKVEQKEEIRKRLGRSPDRGDAVVMAWAHGWLLERERRETPRYPTRANTSDRQAKRLGMR